MKEEPNFTMNELLALLEPAPGAEILAYTTDEVAMAMGWQKHRVGEYLRRLFLRGEIESCRKSIRTKADYWTTVPAYRKKGEPQ